MRLFVWRLPGMTLLALCLGLGACASPPARF
jgi:hypothetical protein